MSLLLAADGSAYTEKAVQFLIKNRAWLQNDATLHLLHVRLPIPGGLALNRARSLLGDNVVDQYYRDEATAVLAPIEQLLTQHGISFQSCFKVGDIAHEICAYAAEKQVDMIVMGSHGHGAVMNVVMGSVATKVLATTSIPVLIVR